MVSSSLPKNRTARPAYTQQVRSLTRLSLVHPVRHIYTLYWYNSGTPRPLVNPKGRGLNHHTVATQYHPFWTTTFTGHTRWYTQHTTALTGRTTLPVSHSDLAYLTSPGINSVA